MNLLGNSFHFADNHRIGEERTQTKSARPTRDSEKGKKTINTLRNAMDALFSIQFRNFYHLKIPDRSPFTHRNQPT